MSWTDERVETLKKMWAEGQSASQIAKELGGVTRNAVIGKVHRLGLSNRVGGAPDPVKSKADTEPRVEAKPAAAAKPAQPAAKPAPVAPAAARPDPAPAAAAAQPPARKPVRRNRTPDMRAHERDESSLRPIKGLAARGGGRP